MDQLPLAPLSTNTNQKRRQKRRRKGARGSSRFSNGLTAAFPGPDDAIEEGDVQEGSTKDQGTKAGPEAWFEKIIKSLKQQLDDIAEVISRCPTLLLVSVFVSMFFVGFVFAYTRDKDRTPFGGAISFTTRVDDRASEALGYANQTRQYYQQIDGQLEFALESLETLPPTVIQQIQLLGYTDQYYALMGGLESAISEVSQAEVTAGDMYSTIESISESTKKIKIKTRAISDDFKECWIGTSWVGLVVAITSVVESMRAFKRLDNRLRAGKLRASGKWDLWTSSKLVQKHGITASGAVLVSF